MTAITRFAPSPTGLLHVGNVRAALHNWLLARRLGGRFMLRIDDTDRERSRDEFVDAIRRDLAWLGLSPDGEERQSLRGALYERVFARLRDAGHIYPCYETAQELELKRKVQLGRGLPPIYDRAALSLTDNDHAQFEADGVRPHWRFKLDHASPIAWDDAIRGPQRFDPAQLSDPVIRRADGSWLYMLPSVIDDLEMGVTHVVRGEDHVSNTAAQIQMFTAVGAVDESLARPLPLFAHEALLVGKEGKLSKRLGSLTVESLRESGVEAIAIAALLARLGTSQPVEAVTSLAPLAESFDLAHFGRAPARFDEEDLARLNAATLHQLDYPSVRDRLPPAMTLAGWEALRPNLTRLSDIHDLWRLVTGPIAAPTFDADDRAFLAEAAERLSWSQQPWQDLTKSLSGATGRRGKALFLPLRQALTGLDHGPEMAALLPLIGEKEARTRLRRAAQG